MAESENRGPNMKVFFSGFAAFLVLLGIWSSGGKDVLHEILDPIGYWEKKVRHYEMLANLTKESLQFCRLEYGRLDRTRDILHKENRLSGMTPAESAAMIREEALAIREECRGLREILEGDNKRLDGARNKLSIAKGG